MSWLDRRLLHDDALPRSMIDIMTPAVAGDGGLRFAGRKRCPNVALDRRLQRLTPPMVGEPLVGFADAASPGRSKQPEKRTLHGMSLHTGLSGIRGHEPSTPDYEPSMFVISLIYQKPLSEVEAHIAAHRDFLDRNYEAGIFLASGPKNPRVGGVILASSKVSREQLDALLTEDPFHAYDLARYEVIEFTPSKFAPALEGVI